MKKYISILSIMFIISGLSAVNAQDILHKEIIAEKDGARMVLIPGGPFIYGMADNKMMMILKRLGSERSLLVTEKHPEQQKVLPDFYIDKYEVTNEQYMEFVKETGHEKPQYWNDRRFNRDKQPVVGISLEDARAYAKWAGKRLPTEEEWEKAARGTDGRYWPWGNDPGSNKYNGKGQGNWNPIIVGSYPQGNSPYDLCDMAGNVWEMTGSNFDRDSYVIRGGSYLNQGVDTLTFARLRLSEKDEKRGTRWLGFRCVMDIIPGSLKNLKPITKTP